MDAYFTSLGSPRKRWRGKLRQVLPTPEVVNNVVLYTALFEVDNTSGDLMTQMTAQVFFVIAGATNVVSVPASALRRTEGRRGDVTVVVVDDSGVQSERKVTIGVSNRVAAEVISGLKEGDRVVAGTKTKETTSTRRNGGGGGAGGFRGPS
jgi:macrolide-specific efflux system membrane fusion protein